MKIWRVSVCYHVTGPTEWTFAIIINDLIVYLRRKQVIQRVDVPLEDCINCFRYNGPVWWTFSVLEGRVTDTIQRVCSNGQ